MLADVSTTATTIKTTTTGMCKDFSISIEIPIRVERALDSKLQIIKDIYLIYKLIKFCIEMSTQSLSHWISQNPILLCSKWESNPDRESVRAESDTHYTTD